MTLSPPIGIGGPAMENPVRSSLISSVTPPKVNMRATVLDAFSLNLRTTIAGDACFDRSEASHAINLCDMHAKYADVVPAADALGFIETIDAEYNLPSGKALGG